MEADNNHKTNGETVQNGSIDLELQSNEEEEEPNKCCTCCLLSENPLPDNPGILALFRWYLLCPPHGELGWLLMRVLGCSIAWIALWGIAGIEHAGPQGDLSSVFVIYVFARLMGFLASKIYLPPLVGMLLGGALLNYSCIGNWHVANSIPFHTKYILRGIAFIAILIRAGLSINPRTHKVQYAVLRLAALPGVISEAPVIAITSYYLLGLPFSMSLLLGFILAAVSPAVVVPPLLHLQNKGFGVEQNIPRLVISAACLDDTIAIGAFSLTMVFTFAQVKIQFIPIEMLIGIGSSCLIGMLLWYIPPQTRNELDKHGARVRNPENHTAARFLLLSGFGMGYVFGFAELGFTGTGLIGCFSVAFVAGLAWDYDTRRPVGEAFGHVWNQLMPLLFGLIGAEVSISHITADFIWRALLVIGAGLLIRIMASFLAVFGQNLKFKEQLFVAIAWIPKATIQAAMCALPLDTARRLSKGTLSKDDVENSQSVLTVVVLSIAISAPFGSLAISYFGRRLLKCTPHKSSHHTHVTWSDGVPRPLELKGDRRQSAPFFELGGSTIS